MKLSVRDVGLFVTGTDTSVGKTVITGGLAGVLRTVPWALTGLPAAWPAWMQWKR